MNKVEKIKAEIGIRIAEICDLTTGCIMDSKTAAEYRLLYELSSFIDSLEEEPISNDLEEAATKYARKQVVNPDYPTYNDEYELESAFETGAKWGMEQAEVKIQAQSIAVAHGCPKESVSNDLEEAACEYDNSHIDDNNLAFKAGAQWQKERDQSTIELAEDHAYLAGQEKIIAKAIKWLEDNIDRYLYNTGGYGEYIPKCGGKMFEDFKKAMEK